MTTKVSKFSSQALKRVVSAAALLCAGTVAASAGNIDLGTFGVDAKSSYLLASANDTTVNPLFINLATLSTPVSAGDILILATVGDYCNVGGWGCSSETSQALGGVFSSLGPSSLLATNVQHRLPGAILTPGVADSPDPAAWFGGTTTIAEDFQMSTGSGLTVTVPNNAHWLVVGVLDSYYGDNSDPNHNLGLHILLDPVEHPTVTTTPEPSTCALLLTGFGGLWGMRRIRSRRS